MSLIIKDDEHFKKVFEEKKAKPIILFFTAKWCGPCKMMKPIVEETAEKTTDRLTVLRVDVDECDETCKQYSVSAMPTFVLVVNGEVKESFAGYSPPKLQHMFDKALQR